GERVKKTPPVTLGYRTAAPISQCNLLPGCPGHSYNPHTPGGPVRRRPVRPYRGPPDPPRDRRGLTSTGRKWCRMRPTGLLTALVMGVVPVSGFARQPAPESPL